MTTREQRLVFGEAAELYDRARPGYAPEVVDAVLEYCGTPADPCRALEVGAGTGKATVAFAATGMSVVALEPDPSMAEVCTRNCAAYPSVRVVRASFEDWHPGPAPFDLLYSAQAWHWVRPERRCALAAAHVRPGGTLALLWHRVRWAADEPVRVALDECYRRFAPDLYAKGPGFPGLTPAALEERATEELAACEDFAGLVVTEHPWTTAFSADAFVERLRTQSDHRMLDEGERERLLDAVRATVVEHAGGEPLEVPHDTLTLLARRRQ